MTINRYDIGPLMSQAVVHGDTVYLAGTVADDVSQDVKGQTQQILDKIEARLNEVGSSKSKMLSATIWLDDIGDRDLINEVWVEWIDKESPPARACIESKLARPDMLIEIMVTAAI